MNKKTVTNTPSSRSVSVRDIMLFLLRPILRTKTLRNDEAGVRGFTLIELLVVVLIIGILSAIALPQYRVAVVKSRAAAILPLLRAISTANHAYYLANGTRTFNVTNLDIQLPGNCSMTYGTGNPITNGQLWTCGTDWLIDNSGGESVIANYCPGYNENLDMCVPKRDFRVFVQWTPTNGYLVDCHPLNSSVFGERICKSLALNN